MRSSRWACWPGRYITGVERPMLSVPKSFRAHIANCRTVTLTRHMRGGAVCPAQVWGFTPVSLARGRLAYARQKPAITTTPAAKQHRGLTWSAQQEPAPAEVSRGGAGGLPPTPLPPPPRLLRPKVVGAGRGGNPPSLSLEVNSKCSPQTGLLQNARNCAGSVLSSLFEGRGPAETPDVAVGQNSSV